MRQAAARLVRWRPSDSKQNRARARATSNAHDIALCIGVYGWFLSVGSNTGIEKADIADFSIDPHGSCGAQCACARSNGIRCKTPSTFSSYVRRAAKRAIYNSSAQRREHLCDDDDDDDVIDAILSAHTTRSRRAEHVMQSRALEIRGLCASVDLSAVSAARQNRHAAVQKAIQTEPTTTLPPQARLLCRRTFAVALDALTLALFSHRHRRTRQALGRRARRAK